MGGTPTVLIVDDIEDTVALYADILDDKWRVRTAYDGEEALAKLDATVDVVLLDRRMPGLSGYDVVQEIRAQNLDARIAIVTASEPDFDIVEYEFDEYVTKPVSVSELRETVEDLLARTDYDDRVQKYFAVVSKLAALEAEKTDDELENTDAYAELQRRYESLSEELGDTVDRLETQQPGAAFEELV